MRRTRCVASRSSRPLSMILDVRSCDAKGPAVPLQSLDRRRLLSLAGTGLIAGLVAGCGSSAVEEAAAPQRDDARTFTPRFAKSRLVEGNERFVTGEVLHPDQAVSRRAALAAGQKPFTAVLSCADSRVPPEIVFDQGLGDVFVVRSAGQVVDHAVLGSLQYGIEHLGVSLLVVLGHTGCGAVKATLEALQTKAGKTGTDIDALVAAITPAVRSLASSGKKIEQILTPAVEANVERIAKALEKDRVVEEAVKKKNIEVVGAVYTLDTGEVEFL